MNTKTITLTPDQVRAALAGRLEQVRWPVVLSDPSQTYAVHDDDGWPCSADEAGDWHRDRCPWGVVGDRLWVREDYDLVDDPGTDRPVRKTWDKEEQRSIYWAVDYKIDGGTRIMDKLGQRVWRDACTMPRWASRLAFDITGIRVERLGDMSDDDAEKCGACGIRDMAFAVALGNLHAKAYRLNYADDWTAQHGQRYPWASNCWVWVIDVRKVGE